MMIMLRIINNRKGSVVILAYLVIVLLIALTGTVLYRAISELNLAKRNILSTEAFYLAEAGVTQAAYELTEAIVNYQVEPIVLNDVLTGLSPDFNVTYSCVDIDTDQTITDTYGIATVTRHYKLRATANHISYTDISVTINQILARKKTYTFQHAVFYVDDLEMLPGPDMTLSGKVHSNSDIYIGTHNTFTIDTDYLFSAGDIFNRRKDSSSSMDGDVNIKIAGSSPSAYALIKGPGDINPLDSDRADWVTESQNRWNGTVKSSDHGIVSLAAPSVASIQTDGYYANQANVKIENGMVMQGGSALVEGIDIPNGTITTTTTFYSNRENKWIRMTEVDIRKLAGYDSGDPDGSPSFGNYLSDNGLIYASRNDAGSGEQAGIRLGNASKIERAGGLTLVSDLPVYIQGDYNNVDKKPAAIFCDAVNILSNDWDDVNSNLHLNNRIAANTQINLAFISGIDTTTSGNYNGGLENYPRFHEKWSGKTLSIRGSFVQLWETQIAQGGWLYGNPQYTAPLRDWDYDTDFNDVSKLPPFTPFAVELESKVWWKG